MAEAASRMIQQAICKIKTGALNHKKKLLFALLLLATGYIAKKKMTLEHVISIVQLLSRLVQSLPLPEAPRLRQIADYEHPGTTPLASILEATRLEELKKKITRKQAGWEDLKKAIVTATAMTVTLYNGSSIYFLVQNKYREEFIALQASTQFDEAMFMLRKGLTDQIQSLFSSLQKQLFAEIERIQLSKVYDQSELDLLFERIAEALLREKYDLQQEAVFTSVGRVSAQARNYFLSPYEYQPPRPVSWIYRAGSSALKVLGGFFSVGEILPQARIEVSTQRYQLARAAYLQPLKKATRQLEAEGFVWPNSASRELFGLVVEQLQFVLSSLNFSTMLRANSEYQLKILSNRLRLLLQQKGKSGIRFSDLLPSLYKILQEEFLRGNQFELRNKYHSFWLKKSISIVAALEDSPVDPEPAQPEPLTLQEHVLREIELKEAFLFLQKELQLKIHNERSGFVMRPKASSQKTEADEMKKLLGLVSSSDILNGQDGL